MNSPHLAKGSVQPPKVDGKLRLYSMKLCPYAQRPWMVLEAKKIPYDVVNVNLIDKPDWLFKLHPEGKVPALDTGKEVLVESLDVCDFLDEQYPQVPMYPIDPAAKQKDKDLIQKISPLTDVFYAMLLDKEGKPMKEWRDKLWPHLEVFENELRERGTKHFSGNDKPGMVDYMLWPFAQRAKVAKIILKDDVLTGDDLALIPLLRAWIKQMATDPAVKVTYTTSEQFHKAFLMKFGLIPVDYDNV